MPLGQYSELGGVLLNKGNAWTIPAVASGVTGANLPSFDLFQVSEYMITSVHASIAFTALIGLLSIYNIVLAIYERHLNIRIKLNKLAKSERDNGTGQ